MSGIGRASAREPSKGRRNYCVRERQHRYTSYIVWSCMFLSVGPLLRLTFSLLSCARVIISSCTPRLNCEVSFRLPQLAPRPGGDKRLWGRAITTALVANKCATAAGNNDSDEAFSPLHLAAAVAMDKLSLFEMAAPHWRAAAAASECSCPHHSWPFHLVCNARAGRNITDLPQLIPCGHRFQIQSYAVSSRLGGCGGNHACLSKSRVYWRRFASSLAFSLQTGWFWFALAGCNGAVSGHAARFFFPAA